MKTLVLFDIDGTLVLTGRAGMRALDRALIEVSGDASLLEGMSFAGRTDRAIVEDALNRLGRPWHEAEFADVRERYCAYLADEVQADSPHFKGVLPGVAAALDALTPLQRDGQVAVGLLTGNFARGAEIKLAYFDLWRAFAFGAFGDHHANRRDLVALAIEAASASGAGEFQASQIVIVGDTPADVDCGHAHGARVIAVATGGYSEAQLRETGADVVVPDLTAWPSAWAALQA